MRSRWHSKIVLGLLVAATGVGAGDLITASLAGSNLGLVILWAAVAGALLKWVLNEGIARWQMATSSTFLEGWVKHLGGIVRWVFFAYFLAWSYIVVGALFMPFVALTLLILNNRVRLVGPGFRNGRLVNSLLAVTLAFFLFFGLCEIAGLL